MSDLVSREKILVLDDDHEVNNLLKAILERLGYVVVQAFSKDEALTTLISTWPIMIFVDKNLEGSADLEGIRFLQTVSTFPRAKRIVKILMGNDINLDEDGFETFEYYREQWSLDLDGLLPKPFGFEQIKAMFRFHLLFNRSCKP